MQICFTFDTASSEVIFAHLIHALFFRWRLVMYYLITDLLVHSDSFEYFRKITNQEKQRLIAFIYVNMIQHPDILKNNMNHLSKRGPSPFFHSDTNLVLGNVLVHSVEKNPCSGCNRGINLAVVLEYSFPQLCSNDKQISQVQKIQKKLYVHLSVVVQTKHHEMWIAFFCLTRTVESDHIPFLLLIFRNDSAFA